VLWTLKMGPIRPVWPAQTSQYWFPVSFTPGSSLVRSQPGDQVYCRSSEKVSSRTKWALCLLRVFRVGSGGGWHRPGNGRTTRRSSALGGAYTTAPPATGTDALWRTGSGELHVDSGPRAGERRCWSLRASRSLGAADPVTSGVIVPRAQGGPDHIGEVL